jgi:hypothetical protein
LGRGSVALRKLLLAPSLLLTLGKPLFFKQLLATPFVHQPFPLALIPCQALVLGDAAISLQELPLTLLQVQPATFLFAVRQALTLDQFPTPAFVPFSFFTLLAFASQALFFHAAAGVFVWIFPGPVALRLFPLACLLPLVFRFRLAFTAFLAAVFRLLVADLLAFSRFPPAPFFEFHPFPRLPQDLFFSPGFLGTAEFFLRPLGLVLALDPVRAQQR